MKNKKKTKKSKFKSKTKTRDKRHATCKVTKSSKGEVELHLQVPVPKEVDLPEQQSTWAYSEEKHSFMAYWVSIVIALIIAVLTPFVISWIGITGLTKLSLVVIISFTQGILIGLYLPKQIQKWI